MDSESTLVIQWLIGMLCNKDDNISFEEAFEDVFDRCNRVNCKKCAMSSKDDNKNCKRTIDSARSILAKYVNISKLNLNI